MGAFRRAGKTPPQGWLALLGLLAVLLTACSSTSPHTAATATPGLAANQTLRAAVIDTAGQPTLRLLDPAAAPTTAEQEVASLLFDGLVTTDGQLGVEPWGASNIAVSSDGLTYTFTLRDGQSFSDGTPVTATDYAFSLDRALNPCQGFPSASYLFDIKNAERYYDQLCHNGTITAGQGPQSPPGAVITTLVGTSIVPDDADRTLTITLAHPTGYFLEELAAAAADVLDPAVVGATTSQSDWTGHLTDGPTGRGGSGMYYLAARVSAGNGATRLTLKPNPHWWGIAAGKRPHLTEIDLFAYPSAAQSMDAYTGGQVDVAFLPPTPAGQGTQTPAVVAPGTHLVPLATTYALGLNWATPPMNSADAREALCLAIDRNALLRQVGAADATIQGMPTWHLVPAGTPGYNASLAGPDGVTSLTGDPNAARAHWQKYVQSLGSTPVPSFYYLYLEGPGGSGWQVALGTALQSQWQAVLGVSVQVKALPAGALQDSNNTVFSGPAHPVQWQVGEVADPYEYLSLQFVPGPDYADVANVNDPAATALLKGADTQPDLTTRVQEYQQAEQLLVREAATCPLWQAAETYEAQPWVRGWSLTALGIPTRDTWLATTIQQH